MGFGFVLHCVVFRQSFSGSRVKVNHAKTRPFPDQAREETVVVYCGVATVPV